MLRSIQVPRRVPPTVRAAIQPMDAWNGSGRALHRIRQWRSIGVVVKRWISVVETRSYQARAQKLLT